MKIVYILLLILFSMTVICAHADGLNEEEISNKSRAIETLLLDDKKNTPSNMTIIVKSFGGMFIIVAFIIFLAWCAKRLNIQNLTGHKNMKVLEVLPLGSREKAIIVDIYGEHVLIGVSTGSVNYLKTLDPLKSKAVNTDKDINRKETHSAWESQSSTIDFAKKINEFLSNGK